MEHAVRTRRECDDLLAYIYTMTTESRDLAKISEVTAPVQHAIDRMRDCIKSDHFSDAITYAEDITHRLNDCRSPDVRLIVAMVMDIHRWLSSRLQSECCSGESC